MLEISIFFLKSVFIRIINYSSGTSKPPIITLIMDIHNYDIIISHDDNNWYNSLFLYCKVSLNFNGLTPVSLALLIAFRII